MFLHPDVVHIVKVTQFPVIHCIKEVKYVTRHAQESQWKHRNFTNSSDPPCLWNNTCNNLYNGTCT